MTAATLVVSIACPATALTASTGPPTTNSPSTPSTTGVPGTLALVELTGLDPLDAASADTVTFRGTVSNQSDQTLTALNAYLRLSRIPLADRGDVDRIAEPGFRPGARQAAFVLAADTLEPGATASFVLEVPTADLRLVQAGVYAAGIEVLATGTDGSRGVVGRAVTALPWMPADAEIVPIGVAMAWPVTAGVDRATDGSYLSEDLGEALAAGGRLAALLGVSPTAQATWLVDPAVVEAAADLADGYEVRSDPLDPATVQAGTHTGDAADWLEQVTRLADSGRVTLTTYADVDAVALSRAGRGDDIVAALDAATSAAASGGLQPADGPRGLFRPPGGLLDQPTAERLAAAGVTTLLLDPSGVDSAGTATTVRLDVGGGQLVAVLADEVLRDLFVADPASAPTGEPATALGARQVLLAHTALAALAPSGDAGSAGQSVLVVAGDEASTISPTAVLDALDQHVPWIEQVSLDAVQATPTADTELTYPADSTGELPAAYIAQVTALDQQADLLAGLTGGAAGAGQAEPIGSTGIDSRTAARLRLLSAAWRTDPARATQVLADTSRSIDAELAQVRILDGGSITLSSRTGRFPLTVVNDLSVPVSVQLTLDSRAPARLRVPSVTGVEVAPGSSTTVDVSAEANANGEYVVDAQLATSTGAPFGPASTLTIRATDYDTVAWIVMGVAGGLLLVGSVRRITRRVRAARAGPAPETVQR